MMNKNYRKIRMGIAAFMAAMMSIAVTQDNLLLAIGSVLIGMVFVAVSKPKNNRMVDEREIMVRQKAAQMAYAIFAPTIGLGSVLMIILASDELYLLQTIGYVLAYLSLFLIALYSISYFFLNRKFSGNGEE